MDEKFWHSKWESDDIGFHQTEVNTHLIEYIPKLKLAPDAQIFVPLCGKSLDMLWLAKQGYQVIGIELSLKACHDFFLENQIPYHEENMGELKCLYSDKIKLFCRDFFKLDKATLGKIDAIYDRAALIALPSDLRQSYVNHLSHLSQDKAPTLLITVQYNQSQMQGPPFSVPKEEVQALFSEKSAVNLIKEINIADIPIHLQEKGLTHAYELVFSLKPLQ